MGYKHPNLRMAIVHFRTRDQRVLDSMEMRQVQFYTPWGYSLGALNRIRVKTSFDFEKVPSTTLNYRHSLIFFLKLQK